MLPLLLLRLPTIPDYIIYQACKKIFVVRYFRVFYKAGVVPAVKARRQAQDAGCNVHKSCTV